MNQIHLTPNPLAWNIKDAHYGIYHNQIYISTQKITPQRNQCQKRKI